MTDKIHFADEDCVWIDGRQFISLKRVGKMLTEKKMTNADRIRGMTDEELVEFLAPYNSGCPKEHGSVMTCHDKGCYKCWEVWLKKEVKEE